MFDTDLFLYAALNFELDDVLVPVPFIPAFGNDFFGAGYHFVIDKGGAYMCVILHLSKSSIYKCTFCIYNIFILHFCGVLLASNKAFKVIIRVHNIQ